MNANEPSVCRVPWCGKLISPSVVMCRDDWLRTPQALRDRILAEQQRGGGSAGYWAAVAEAVAWHVANPSVGGQLRLEASL